ncbi:MAG: hypothetical protein ACLRMN_10990 [Mediterraneibacter gnavus]
MANINQARKISRNVNCRICKKNLFTYTEKKVVHVLHEELNLTDKDIEEFLDKVDVDINAEDYQEQQDKVISGLEEIFRCDRFECRILLL